MGSEVASLAELLAGRLDVELDGLLDEAVVVVRFIDADGVARLEIGATEGVDLVTRAGLLRWGQVVTDREIVAGLIGGDE